MKYKLKNSWLDYVLISVLLVASILFSVFFYLNPTKGNVVGVYIQGVKTHELRLSEDTVLVLSPADYPSLLGEMVIEVKGGRVRVAKEESPKNLCSRQGWASASGWMITCLPNDVYLLIEGDADDGYDTPPVGYYYIGSVVYAS